MSSLEQIWPILTIPRTAWCKSICNILPFIDIRMINTLSLVRVECTTDTEIVFSCYSHIRHKKSVESLCTMSAVQATIVYCMINTVNSAHLLHCMPLNTSTISAFTSYASIKAVSWTYTHKVLTIRFTATLDHIYEKWQHMATSQAHLWLYTTNSLVPLHGWNFVGIKTYIHVMNCNQTNCHNKSELNKTIMQVAGMHCFYDINNITQTQNCNSLLLVWKCDPLIMNTSKLHPLSTFQYCTALHFLGDRL